MNITIVGTGYVGLVSGTCFAETGITVTCVDVDQTKIDNLNKGIIPIYEPGLEPMVKRNMEKGRLFFSNSLKDSISDADAVFIAVGTPPDEDGSADLQYVIGVAREIGQYIDHYLVVVTKSTVPIGTAEKVKAALKNELTSRNVDIQFDVASNPEFLKEGAAIDDFLKPDRVVIGTESERAQAVMTKLYKPFLMNNHPVIFMDIPSAEMTKYAANSMLATKISFMNDIANLCEIVGADVNNVRRGIGSDSRIGNKFIYPGTGYGGSCFPKDVQALIKTAEQKGHPLEILKSVELVNNRQKSVLYKKMMAHFDGDLKGKKIALWGLSFKPNTDDMREAPSLVIINKLLSEGAEVIAYDPVAAKECHRKIGDTISYAKDQYEALIDADALLIVTEWSEFRVPNFKVMEKLMKEKLIFDGRNIYDLDEMKDLNYTYYSIGREVVTKASIA
ncbi:UDP-glucose dehydrogenase family protein [Labilibaculum euxinus]|uniref:UDP-glucose 6-dehydrogenase n=1 Tax=Labilibaculum euxinus TaxID=2686357 RepID=A0A7M4DBB1_9BACT|nr:UDP-glucose/GDP-mannose dehydrogenase family protein [Labilibaculum euxinus]MUP39940.1 nucleotide sugar dehydrogenase [Labilibaculum euxinus]MVB09145.1 nucleotide sugar dehydrogenase [Labilibaculum euxinus]